MLEAVRLINCQSIEDATLDFSIDRVNVIVADNNTGKSILFKMLKTTANPNWLPNKKRKQLIRHGASNASMICGFSDGSIGITTVLENSVIYRYKDADSQDFTTYQRAPEEYINQLGLIVDSKTKFIANIIDTDQDMLLVNSDLKGNNELLCALAECADLLEVKDKVSQLMKAFTEANTKLLIKETSLQQVLASLEHEDITALESVCRNGDILYNALGSLNKAENALEIITQCNSDTFNYNYCIGLIETLQICKEISELLSCIYCGDIIDSKLIDIAIVFENICKVLAEIKLTPSIDFDTGALESFISAIDKLNSIAVIHSIDDIEVLDSLLCVKSCNSNLRNILNNFSSIYSIEVDCNKIKEDIIRSGKQTHCPIHGEVIYNGEECIPYNL